jgi:hypothetical protein
MGKMLLLPPSFMGRENGTKIEESMGWESFGMSKNSKKHAYPQRLC